MAMQNPNKAPQPKNLQEMLENYAATKSPTAALTSGLFNQQKKKFDNEFQRRKAELPYSQRMGGLGSVMPPAWQEQNKQGGGAAPAP
jgi:hypothetical protein